MAYKKKHSNHEFELDLAPLLSVMVKLVPVLLLSSAFVQVMVIETDLPQAVKEAIQQQQANPTANIQLAIDSKSGFQVIIQKGQNQTVEKVPLKDGAWDLKGLHLTLQRVKTQNPEVFRIEFSPAADVPYKDIVRMMDEARQSKDKSVKFPINDKKENRQILTDFMFPDVVFTNVMDG
ncbi:MAG: ExbD/TolR family protein [Pseudobdellovibrionaceae bacterium]